MIQVDVADEGHAQIEGAAVAQLIDPPPQHLPVDAVRAAVDEDAQRRRAGSRVVEQQAIAVVRLERVNGESHVSNRLNGAEDVDDPRPLESRLAAEIGGGPAQDVLDPPRLADQFAMAAHEQVPRRR